MVSLKKAFERKQKMAIKMSDVEHDFNKAYGNSKYQDIEIPDDLIDSIDYGHGSITWKEFKERMDEEFEESRGLTK